MRIKTIQRITGILLRSLLQSPKEILQFFLVFIVFFTVMLYLDNKSFQQSSIYAIANFGLLGFIIFPSQIYKKALGPKQGNFFLMLPATAKEKYASIIAASVIAGLAVFLVCMLVLVIGIYCLIHYSAADGREVIRYFDLKTHSIEWIILAFSFVFALFSWAVYKAPQTAYKELHQKGFDYQKFLETVLRAIVIALPIFAILAVLIWFSDVDAVKLIVDFVLFVTGIVLLYKGNERMTQLQQGFEHLDD